MEHSPKTIELERRDASLNVCRFYRLELEHDLLGEVLARRTWGRIGTRGSSKVMAFATDAEAMAQLRRWEILKRRRGYVDYKPLSLRFEARNAEIISAWN